MTDTAFMSRDTGAIVSLGGKSQVVGDRVAIATRGLSDGLWRTARALKNFPDYDSKRDAIRDAMTAEYRHELRRHRRLASIRGFSRTWATRLADASESVRPIFHTDICLVGYSQKAKKFRATLSTSQAPTPYAPWPFAPAQFERDILLPFLNDDERLSAGYIRNNPGSIYRYNWNDVPKTLVRLMDVQREKCLEQRRQATSEKEWRAPEIIGGEAVLTTLYSDGKVEKSVVHSWGDTLGIPMVEKPHK